MKKYIAAAAIAATTLVAATSSIAQSVADFYKGKQIRFVLGAAAGQDYDLWARIIAKHITKHLPGNPSIIVENMPGGGHMIATNWLYNVAARDGTVWGMVSRNVSTQALLKVPSAKFEPTKFKWIGSPEINSRGCFAMTRSGITEAKQLFERELIVGGTGAGSAVSQTPTLLPPLLGMKIKLVEGYQKPQDAVLAMERGEVGGICQTVQSFMRERQDWFTSGTAKLLFTLERKPVAGLNVPTVYEFAKTDEQKRILDFYSSSIELGRPIMLPPDVPADRVNAVRRAFDATVADKAFRAEAEKIGFEITVRTGEEIETLINELMATPPDIVKKTAELAKIKAGD